MLFIARELMAERPFINLRVLKNPTIGASTTLMVVLGAVSLGSTYVIPLYCAQIQGYNAEQIGWVVMWSGIPQLLRLPDDAAADAPRRPAPARRRRHAAVRLQSCWLNVNLTHDVGMDELILPQLLRAAGSRCSRSRCRSSRPPACRRATRRTRRRSPT